MSERALVLVVEDEQAIEQLLDLSRLEAGSIPLRREPFAVVELLEDVTREALVHTPQVPVVVDADSSLLVDGDRERVHQVIANLVENAARYSQPGAKIEIVARQRGAAVSIEVLDEGPGTQRDQPSTVARRRPRRPLLLRGATNALSAQWPAPVQRSVEAEIADQQRSR